MNESGRALPPLLRRTSIDDFSNLVIVHDELDLEPGRVQLKFGGGLAGHNGLRSIAQTLGTQDFGRLRIGIGKPPRKEQGADYVLKRPTGSFASRSPSTWRSLLTPSRRCSTTALKRRNSASTDRERHRAPTDSRATRARDARIGCSGFICRLELRDAARHRRVVTG